MMQLRALGPLEAVGDDGPIGLGGPKQQAVLALLVAARGRALPDDVIVTEVWGDEATPRTRHTLQTYVSNLRSALGDGVVIRTGEGYRLELEHQQVDVWRFERAVAAARESLADHPADATRQLDAALQLWRGRPYAGTQHTPRLDEDVRHLEALHLAALEDRIDASLRAEDRSTPITEVAELARQHPTRERLQGLYMLALYRAGRQGDALEVYDRTRTYLRDELGIDPSPPLQTMHRRILEQDPTLLDTHEGTVGEPADAATDAPSGQVTFVFTDIEGSTRLFHELGDGYAEVLVEHRRIIREASAANDGYEVSVDGDGMLLAFASVPDAARTCVEAQRGLASADWPRGVDLRVRMGIHTGLASPRHGDYVSLAIHEAARVMSAANGGQVLVSEQAADKLVGLPDIELRQRGRFRLRGFEQPVRLYDLHAEGLRGDVGPVRATPADRHNLVRQPTTTLGRDDLIDTVGEALGPGQLVTLIGPGGVGKTRVASEVGIRVANEWDDGVWFVDLATVGELDLVTAAIADAVAAPRLPDRDRTADLVEHLAPRSCVVILDNCEHVASACRRLLDTLLGACPDVAVLATSREPLHAPGEMLRPVAPLALPPEGTTDPGTVRAASACALFEQRGRDRRPDFTIDDTNAADVAVLCRRLDGLPLLIELAAALLSVQSVPEILAGLDDRDSLLRSSDPFESERHRSIEGLIGWSYRLLTDAEQAAFRRLAIFGASFSLETATAAVADGDLDAGDVPRLVWTLVERSLVVADLRASETRYRLLATIRHYGRERLREAGEVAEVATRLATTFLERLGPWRPTEWSWVGEVGVELDNLRALLPFLPEDEHELAQSIACSIGRYHDATQSFREGIDELERYAASFTTGSPSRVALLARLADLHLRTGDATAAAELVTRAREVEQEHGAPEWDDVAVDRTRGEIARRRGDHERAAEIAREALTRDLSDRGRSRMLNLLGTSLAPTGDLDGAREALREQLRLNRRLGFEASVASSHGNLAEVALRLGDLEEAAHHQRACLELAMSQGSPAMVAFSLIVGARLAGSASDWETAVLLHARAEALLDELGLRLYQDDRQESEALLATARMELGDGTFSSLAADGRLLPVPKAAELADAVFARMEPELEIDVLDGSVGVR